MPSEPPLLPIREVTRLTGVNPVTLRAWERRYGLIVPHRTSKGHRLYANEHVQRIQQILHWLNRGVAVGQVKPLLDSPPPVADSAPDDDWHALRLRLIECLEQLAERRLDQLINQVMALYPATTLCEQLFLPLLNQLDTRWHGHPAARMERVFFHSWLRSKLGGRVYHNNRQLSGAPALLLNGSNLPFDAQLWLCAWLLSDSGRAVEVFDWPIPARELAFAVEGLSADAVLVSLNAAADSAELQSGLALIGGPKLVFGSAVSLYGKALASHDLTLFDSPLSAARHLLSS
ncbi:helix-turn-helix-type transcriptional regulator [Pseudomonas sp. SDI]|uniref:MerR family transcriptional regulator n=1 Tax=Pseudomonas sp. SDI TaxID=2170734 RepID=UPI000DE682A4|nr:MerR family transcriptional regulator [Pseudomonas sp. SDI]PWB35372.1 helix-turn-helix-type transcriptional regulator [Pseudomonas sp. SDI]